MKRMISLCLCFFFLGLFAACGGQPSAPPSGSGQSQGQGGGQKAQSQNGRQPIDTELRQQMNMYKSIKQYEFEEAEKQRMLDKQQLKKLQKARQQSGESSGGSEKKQQGGESGGQSGGKEGGSSGGKQ